MTNNIVRILVLLLGLGVALQATPVRAAVRLGVTPSIVELSGNPGSSGSFELTVLNQGDEPFAIEIGAQDYDRAAPERSVPSWVEPKTTSASLAVAEQLPVSIMLTIPEDAKPGGYYATVSIATVTDTEGDNAAGISGQLLVPLLITVNGDFEKSGNIDQLIPVLELDGRLGFRTQVTNDGEIHWKPTGLVTITLADGDDYGTLDVEQFTLFPDTTQLMSTTSTLPVQPDEEFKASVALDYGEDDPLEAETEFTFAQNLTISGSACENLDRGPTMTTHLENAGSLGIISNLIMSVTTADGQPIGQTGQIGPEIALPTETTDIGADLPDRLQTGDYILTVAVQTGASADPIITEVPFSIGGTGPNVAPICENPTLEDEAA